MSGSIKDDKRLSRDCAGRWDFSVCVFACRARLKSLSRGPACHSSIAPADQMNGAACVTRTRDPVITNDVLYRLS